jgi:CHAD domain-containing protein
LRRRSRRIRRCLGEIRNADVTLRLATDLGRKLPRAARRDFQPLVARLKMEAAALRRRTIHGNGIPVPGIRRRIARTLRANLRCRQRDLERQAASILASRLDHLSLALQHSLASTPEAMHRLRIAVKRYRYALEFLEKSGRIDLKDDVEEARTLQGALGHLHDLDVLLQMVRSPAAPRLSSLAERLTKERKGQLARARAILQGSARLQARLAFPSRQGAS